MHAKVGNKRGRKPAATQRQRGVTQPGELTLQEAADGVGVSVVTISKYFKRGCPRTSVQAIQKWREENIKAVASDADPSELLVELKRAEIADKAEAARARKLKNDEREKLLVSRTDVVRELALVLSRMKSRVLTLGTECALVCPDALKVPVKQAVDRAVHTALKEITDGLAEWE